MKKRLTIQEAAELLNISETAVHKRIKAGTLSAEKINGRWIVEGASLQSSLAAPPKPGRPSEARQYMLMNGPYEVMGFSYQPKTETFKPGSVMDLARAPMGTITRQGKGKAEGLQNWWRRRSIPDSRNGLDEKLKKLGLSNPSQLPFRNLGLSLSDQYWIRPQGADINWADVNYFQNPFGSNADGWDEWMGQVGLSSPDNTSEGALPKRWLCRGSERILLKGHSPWTDQQVYNEVVATRLYERLLLPSQFVSYEAVEAGSLGMVSACACFIGPGEEYVPFSLVMNSEEKRPYETTYDAVVRLSANLGIPKKESKAFLSRMIVCDAIMANTDRHLRNFGLIRNIDDLNWRFAPLFDTGNSLWFDKDEGSVARGDYSYNARPFDGRQARQLTFVEDLEWLDLQKLNGFADEACEILEQGNLSRWRTDYLQKGIERQVELVRMICG